MSLSETIADAFISALAQDIQAHGCRNPQQAAEWILGQGHDGIERRLREIASSDRFSDSFKGVDLQAAAFIDYANVGNLGGVEAALQVGLSPDTANNRGKTVLMRCAQSGSAAACSCIRVLLDARADVNLQAEDGMTAFHVACEEAREGELLELLEVPSVTGFFAHDERRQTPLDCLRLPRPSSKRGRAAGTSPLEKPENVPTLEERVEMALRVARYVSGVLPGTYSSGQELPACYQRAWTPESHRYFPRVFRRMVMLVLLHSARPLCLESGGSNSSLLPAAVWKQVFAFMSRDWVAVRFGGSACGACGQVAWRSGPLGQDYCTLCWEDQVFRTHWMRTTGSNSGTGPLVQIDTHIATSSGSQDDLPDGEYSF